MLVFDVAYCPLVHQGPVGPDCPTPQRQIGADLSEWLVGHLVQTALLNVSQAWSIGFMSGEHAGHSNLAVVIMKELIHKMCTMRGRIVVDYD